MTLGLELQTTIPFCRVAPHTLIKRLAGTEFPIEQKIVHTIHFQRQIIIEVQMLYSELKGPGFIHSFSAIFNKFSQNCQLFKA